MTKVKTWNVTLPITGIVTAQVEALTEKEAIKKALASNVTTDDIEEWEMIERVNQGNVCYCMQPWEAEAEAD